MTRKWISLLVIVALVLALAGVIWAKTAQQGRMAQKPAAAGSMVPRQVPTVAKEFDRCTKTCQTVMPHFTNKFATMNTHEGDRQCWQTCWNRFGDKSKKSASATDTKRLWMTRNSRHMRINQCAQACWRKHHQGQAGVTVAGYRSQPRPCVSGAMSGMMP